MACELDFARIAALIDSRLNPLKEDVREIKATIQVLVDVGRTQAEALAKILAVLQQPSEGSDLRDLIVQVLEEVRQTRHAVTLLNIYVTQKPKP